MSLTIDEEDIVRMKLEIDELQAKLDKKNKDNRIAFVLDEEVLYAKRLALTEKLERKGK